MRTHALLGVLSTITMASSAVLAGCGNGDDTTSKSPPASDASTSDATSDATSDVKAGDGGDAGTSALKHVYIIMMENHAQAQIVNDTNAPRLNGFATMYNTATKYYGVTHPSLPNYLASISGDFQGIWDDCAAGPTSTCEVEEFVPNAGDGTAKQLMTAQQAANAATIPHWFSGRTIVDQLEEHGLTWAAYMGAMNAPGGTDNGAPTIEVDAGPDASADGGPVPLQLNLYAQKHNPFEYFQGIRNNANRMQKIVPFAQFATDIARSTMPNYVWISPDQCADMHGINGPSAAFADAGFCTGSSAGSDMSEDVIRYGDTFVGGVVDTIMASPTWSEGSAIVIVWDEDDYMDTSGCCNSPTGVDGGVLGGALVPAIVISSLVSAPTTSSDPYNHYSLLATIEDMWGLGCLANTCGMSGSALMTRLFLP